jgi:hypothetical protein
MAENCGATNADGSLNEPMHGSGNSDVCWSAMTISSPSTGRSSTLHACGSHYANVYETSSKHDDRSARAWLYGKLLVALLTQKLIRVGRDISPWGYLLPSDQSLA